MKIIYSFYIFKTYFVVNYLLKFLKILKNFKIFILL